MGDGLKGIFDLVETTFWGEDGCLDYLLVCLVLGWELRTDSRIISSRHDGGFDGFTFLAIESFAKSQKQKQSSRLIELWL